MSKSGGVNLYKELFDLKYPVPLYSRKEVDRAGELLRGGIRTYRDAVWASEVLNNWRSCHGYPVNTFQATMRARLKSIDPSALVAQRLKRFPSILDKLNRFDKMKLSRMQDIGGLRAVVSELSQLDSLYQSYKNGRLSHVLVGEKNYVDEPKPSGYRGIHLIYRYNLKEHDTYNGLMVELQMRTRLQHAWATAVETMGTFLDTALKSSQGPEEWLNFFSLASSAFAHIENKSRVPGFEHMSKEETFEAVLKEEVRLGVIDRLSAFTLAVDRITSDKRRGSYYLLVLDPEERKLSFTAYSRERLGEASEAYHRAEADADAQDSTRQVVLVAADSVDALKRAYPNYFLDTQEFSDMLEHIRWNYFD